MTQAVPPASVQHATDLIMRLATASAYGLTAAAAFLMAVILVLRLNMMRRARIRERTLAKWRNVLLDAIMEPKSVDLPKVEQRDWDALIPHWNHLHGFMRGKAREKLVAVGHELGLVVAARGYLRSRSLRRRLLGIVTLGNLRAEYAWSPLRQCLEHSDPAVALGAMRALLAIDAEAALPLAVPAIASREDWSLVSVAAVLHEVGFGLVAPFLAQTAMRSPPPHAVRLIRLLSTAYGTSAGPIIRDILRGASDERLMSVCLQALREPEDLDLARGFLEHPTWFIRVEAASAVGRLGVPGDEQRLAKLLSDKHWWVRYRAAKALASLPFVSMVDLAAIATEHADPFARDIVIQVLAETAVA